jgi:hypothetical protein
MTYKIHAAFGVAWGHICCACAGSRPAGPYAQRQQRRCSLAAYQPSDQSHFNSVRRAPLPARWRRRPWSRHRTALPTPAPPLASFGVLTARLAATGRLLLAAGGAVSVFITRCSNLTVRRYTAMS